MYIHWYITHTHIHTHSTIILYMFSEQKPRHCPGSTTRNIPSRQTAATYTHTRTPTHCPQAWIASPHVSKCQSLDVVGHTFWLSHYILLLTTLLFVNTPSLLEKMLRRYGSLSGKLHMIELEKDPAAHGLGIRLAGNEEGSRARMSVYVEGIDPNGPAGLDGRVHVGDELLEVRSIEMGNKFN